MNTNVTSTSGVIKYTNNSKFVSVSPNNYFAYSTDGINWTDGTISDTSRKWSVICYGNDKFVAVAGGSDTSNVFAYSTDGIHWTEGTISETSRDWSSICYGNDKFVVVDYNTNYYAYSTDGIHWTEGTISSDSSKTWISVCYGNGKFVIVAWNYFAYSTDGINWTEGTISDNNRTWQSVCYGNDKFVAVATNSNYFAYSTDCITWTEGTISSTSRMWKSVCYGKDKFVAVNLMSNYFAYSMDGITWTEIEISTETHNWQSVCYGNDKFVVIDFATNNFAYSIDGINWTISEISSPAGQWNSVYYGNIPSIPTMTFNLSHPELASTDEFSDRVILDVITHHDSPMYLMLNRTDANNSFYIHSPNLGDLELTTDSNRLTYPVGDNLNENCIGGKIHPLCDGFVVYSIYGNNFGSITKQADNATGNLELITGVFKANPFLGQYNGYHGINFYGDSNDVDGFLTPFLDVKYEFSNNHTGISTDGTDVNGISTMVTYTEQYSEDIYYIHYAWVDHVSSISSRYNVLTRKIDVSGESPVISNVVFVTTAMSTGDLANPAFYMDGNNVLHCAFYHSNSTYCQYYKLTRSSEIVDSSWSWDTDSDYITINNLNLMSNYNSGNVQSRMAQSARRMYLVNSNGNLVEFKKNQTF